MLKGTAETQEGVKSANVTEMTIRHDQPDDRVEKTSLYEKRGSNQCTGNSQGKCEKANLYGQNKMKNLEHEKILTSHIGRMVNDLNCWSAASQEASRFDPGWEQQISVCCASTNGTAIL